MTEGSIPSISRIDFLSNFLYFKEDKYILIAYPIQEAAKGLINKIIVLNGGNDGYESDTANAWESFMYREEFIIGYRPFHVAIRINNKI
jgi:hypothetical protein